MIRSLLKVLPVLTMGLAVSATAQNISQQKEMKPAAMPMTQQHPKSMMACGVVENDNCYARSCACSMGGAFEADFLYWRAENRGFVYAYDQKNPDYLSTATPNDNVGSLMRLQSGWDPGFRIGLGGNTDFDRWDVFANWTWFKDRVTASHTRSDITTATSTMGYYPMWPVDQTFAYESDTAFPYQHVSANWKLWHNAIDLELGRAFYITKALSLRPHWGLRGGWINQRFKSSFTLPLYAALESMPVLSEYDFHGKNNFWGVGPRLGMHSSWHIANSSWSILGKASAALLCGQTQVHFLTESLASGSSAFITEWDMRDQFSQLVPNLQIFLGLDWGSCLDCNRYYLGINAGWEADIYWNQFDLPMALRSATAPLAGANSHPVTMEGLTVNVHLDF